TWIPGSWSFMASSAPSPASINVTVTDGSSLDVTFPDPPSGYAIDPFSITDSGNEFSLSSDPAVQVQLNTDVMPVPVGTGNTYRYRVSGNFQVSGSTVQPVDVTVTFTNQSWSFIDLNATAATVSLGSLATTNNRTYLDVTFRPTQGHSLDLSSITDSNAEFV